MATKERLTEDIKYAIELRRLIWLSLIAVRSGTIGLLLGDLTVRRVIFAGAGAFFMLLFAGVIGYLHRRIKALIAQLLEVNCA